MNQPIYCLACDTAIDLSELSFAKANGYDGYFCDNCEYYHYLDKSKHRPKYTLYLEEKSTREDVLNKRNPVKFKKRLSPLRYPGGKSKLIDFIGEQLNDNQLNTIVSPFIGGGSVEFALLESGLTSHLIINDKDPDVFNFWHVVFNNGPALCHYIDTHPLTVNLYETAHRYMLGDDTTHRTPIERAFLFLVNNRCSFSGIYNAGRMGGKNGKLEQLSARYTPRTLIRQIKHLYALGQLPHVTIDIHNQSYEEILETYMWQSNTTFLIDPPYITEQAHSIYKHSFNDNQHHYLFTLLNSFWHSHPSADILVFYDNHERINEFALPEDVRIINRRYSIKRG